MACRKWYAVCSNIPITVKDMDTICKCEKGTFWCGAGRRCPWRRLRKRRMTHALQHAARRRKTLSRAQSRRPPGPRVPRLVEGWRRGHLRCEGALCNALSGGFGGAGHEAVTVNLSCWHPGPLGNDPVALWHCGSSRYIEGPSPRWTLECYCIVVACHSSTSSTGSTSQHHSITSPPRPPPS